MITGDMSLWRASSILLRHRGRDFCSRLADAIESPGADRIHDLRVSARRLRETVALFDGCFDADRLERIRRCARKTGRILGEIRNLDVAHGFFSTMKNQLDGHPGADIDRLYRFRRRKLMGSIRSSLKAVDPARIRRLIRAAYLSPILFAAPGLTCAPHMPFASFARERIEARIAPLGELIASAGCETAAEAQHELRIAIKRFRYRIEITAPLLGDSYHEAHRTLKSYQDVLGRLHDCDVFKGIAATMKLQEPAAASLVASIDEERARQFMGFRSLLASSPLAQVADRVRDGYGSRG